MTTFHSIWTLIALMVFVGIVIWAWSGARKAGFDQASRLPLEDENPMNSPKNTQNTDSGDRRRG